MLRIIARLSRIAFSIPRKSPFTKVTPALSIATSVPVHFINAEVSRDGLSGPLIIPGEHDHSYPKLVQMFDRRGRRFFDRIGDGKNTGGMAINTDKHCRLPLRLELSGLSFE